MKLCWEFQNGKVLVFSSVLNFVLIDSEIIKLHHAANKLKDNTLPGQSEREEGSDEEKALQHIIIRSLFAFFPYLSLSHSH